MPNLPIVARGVAALLLLTAAACSDDTVLVEPPPPAEFDLLYEGDPNGAGGLRLLRLATGQWVELAPGVLARDPVPSPDGSRIAFALVDIQNYVVDLWVVNRDGSGLRQLTNDEGIEEQPAWSPDGQSIAFRSDQGRSGDIHVVSANGGGSVNLTPDPLPGVVEDGRPAWSPDGQRIAFAGNAGGDWDIWTMRRDGTDRRRITNSEDFDTEPTWSPDGSRIAFRRASPATGADLAIVPAEGGAVVRLTLPGHQRQPAWSPDGALIAHVYSTSLSGQPEIHTVRPDGSGLQARTTTGGLNPSWIRHR